MQVVERLIDDKSFSGLGMSGKAQDFVGVHGRIGRVVFMLEVLNDVAGFKGKAII